MQLVLPLALQLALRAERCCLGPTPRSKLSKDVPHVDLRSALRDPKGPRDLSIRQSGAQETKNLLLSWCKRFG